MMHTPEWHEKQKIKKYLASINAWHFSPFMAGRGKAGVPDIIVCMPDRGQFVAIEVKRPGVNTLTALQRQRINEIEKAGGFGVWGQAEKVIQILKLL